MKAPNTSRVRQLVEAGESLAALGWRIVDAHAHLGPTGEMFVPTPDEGTMVAMMDRLGFDLTGISSHLAIGTDYVRGNDVTSAAVRRFPERLFGYVVSNPHDTEPLENELARGFDTLGLVAIKLHPTTHDFSVADPACEPIWRFAAEREAVVLVHTWVGDPRCHPAMFGDLAARYPSIRWILGHSGGTRQGRPEAAQVAREHESIYLDVCGSIITSDEIAWLVRTVGADRVIFGTDVPWLDPRFLLGKAAYSDLADEQLRLLLGENILRLLGRA